MGSIASQKLTCNFSRVRCAERDGFADGMQMVEVCDLAEYDTHHVPATAAGMHSYVNE